MGMLQLPPNGGTPREIATAVNRLIRGKSDNSFRLTLTANASSTNMTNANIEGTSALILAPTTANAAAAIQTTYVSSVSNGSATIVHANNAQVDRTFNVIIIG
jgi:hypothetical protein